MKIRVKNVRSYRTKSGLWMPSTSLAAHRLTVLIQISEGKSPALQHRFNKILATSGWNPAWLQPSAAGITAPLSATHIALEEKLAQARLRRNTF